MKNIFTILALLLLPFGVYGQITLCGGEQACLVASPYTGSLQWQRSPDMISWTNISLATTDTFCLAPLTTAYYRAEVMNGTCDPIYSDTTLINVIPTSNGVDTFFFTGTTQQFIVNCIDSVVITCFGAQGGTVTNGPNPGGLGAIMSGKFNVSDGDTLTIIVGGQGSNEQYTSGGGGGTGVAKGNTPWIIAGGGAGVDFQDASYLGRHAVTTNDGIGGNSGGGAGGTAGGNGGDYIYGGDNISRGGLGWTAGMMGTTGPNGSSSNTVTTFGTFGLGGGGGSVGSGWCNCGAGGGGYSGGGAGNINTSGGGGGSYNIGVNQNNTGGAHTGNGMVIISW